MRNTTHHGTFLAKKRRSGFVRRWCWRLVKFGVGGGLFGALVVFLSVVLFRYPVASLAPDRGGPLLFMDRHGRLLRSVPAPGGRPGRQAWIPLAKVPSAAVSTLLASEDVGFFSHPGVDVRAIGRAFWLNLKQARVGYGASTITMQLMRTVHSAGESRSIANKVKEAILALRLERAMSKSEILEQYLNRVYYGRGAYGIEAAARVYFDKPAASLSISEATILSVLPRSPQRYDLFRHFKRALARRAHLFKLLRKRGMLSAAQIERAQAQPLKPVHKRPPFFAPHFVDALLKQLPADVRRRGGVVHTTLDLTLQRRLQQRVTEHVAQHRTSGVKQAGVVILDTRTGAIRAMVGSADYHKPMGQINITLWRRYPGSALKPFAYALAIEDGASPASIAYEIQGWRSRFGVLTSGQRERGPVRFRDALAGSFNISAIQVLARVGISRMLDRLKRAGLGPLEGDPRRYGHQLVLGSPKVRLLDLASSYGFLVRGGKTSKARWVREIRFAKGEPWQPPTPETSQVFSPAASWLVMDMLADQAARQQTFGSELPVDMHFPIAVKTGTAQGFADTVAIGITREYTVAAWAGSFDGKPIKGLWAMESAAPLVRAGMLLAGQGKALTLPPRPPNIRTARVCMLSGKTPTSLCPHTRREFFVASHPLPPPCDWHRKHPHGHVAVQYPPQAQAWASRHHRIAHATTQPALR